MAITLTPLVTPSPPTSAESAPVDEAPPPAPPVVVASPSPPVSRAVAGPIALGAAGIVGLGVGAFFGFRTFGFKSDREALCAGGCTPGSLAPDDDARSSAIASDIAFGAGVALLASGAAWWFLARRDTTPSRGAVVVAPTVGGVALGATF
jgi:serine/threonine-protein kinase